MMSRMFFLFFSMHVVKKLGGKKYGKTSTSSKERAKNDRFFPLHFNDNCRCRSSFCMHMEWNNLKQTHKKADERKIKNLNLNSCPSHCRFFWTSTQPAACPIDRQNGNAWWWINNIKNWKTHCMSSTDCFRHWSSSNSTKQWKSHFNCVQ